MHQVILLANGTLYYYIPNARENIVWLSHEDAIAEGPSRGSQSRHHGKYPAPVS